MADVFVSYARSDRVRVAPLVAAMEAQGWSVWWDPAITPGQEFDLQIAAELKIAAAVLVVWTPNSVASRWVRGEARVGADRGILVPVRFEGVELPIDVRAFHTTDLDQWSKDDRSAQINEVLRALGATIARARAPWSVTTSSDPAHSVAAGDSGRIAICVLPFANMSGDPEQEYFSDGITEDVITDLSKVSALAVISRNSAFIYKGKNVDVPKLAHELNVSYVLEGSVRKAGGRVRITAQLVNASSNDHVWAERYDRDLNDIFTLQDEIAHAIVRALKLKLLPGEKKAIEQRGTDKPDAYNLYLMARQYYVTGNEGDTQRAEKIVRLCARATEIDPRYARAWALMAIGKMILRYVHGREFDDGLADADRALALDPNLAEAHAAKARIFSEEGHYDASSSEIDSALRLDPDSYEVNRSAAYLRYRQRRMEDAIRYFEKARTLLEIDINSAHMLMSCYTAVGDSQGAVRSARAVLSKTEEILAQDPNSGTAVAYAASAMVTLGDVDRAKEYMNRALLIDPDNLKMRYNFACALTTPLGDIDAGLELLGPIFDKMAIGLLNHARVDPDLDPLRQDPRFKAMVAAAEARLS